MEEKNMKKLALMLLASTSLLAACGGGAAEDSSATGSEDSGIKETLVMGLDDTFAPMGFKDESGEIVGFDVDLAKEVAERLDVEITFQPIDWAMKETELDSGNIDMIWNGYTITDERKEKVLFTEPYLNNSQIIVTMADSDIETKADLAGKVVSTQQGSAAFDAINADETGIGAEFDGGAAILYPTFNDVFNDLESGRSDAIVVDEVLGRYTMKQKGEEKYVVLTDNFGDEEYGVGLRKEDVALKEAIDGALNDMREDGTYDEIYTTWFAE
jgi:polar amino acid transport system substrate-binding protein